MTASLYTAILLAQTALIGHGHHVSKAGYCESCGVETAFVAEQIALLQTCPCWKDRDLAAHELRHVDWRCHPEVVDALASALLRDCDKRVREDSAQSLTKMAPCLPVAHEALCMAARCDPHIWTRHWARKGLAKLHRHGDGPCQVCAVVPSNLASPQIFTEPVLAPLGALLAPSNLIETTTTIRQGESPADLPAIVPGTSPFSGASPSQALPLGPSQPNNIRRGQAPPLLEGPASN